MLDNTLISIITVVYNGEKYLEQTIQSVINQTYTNIEYIIIDGGSTDQTHEIVKKYEKNISYFVSEPDDGLYDAMNKGIKVANGELIGMINSDDWYELDAVENMIKAYSNNPTKKIFHGNIRHIFPDGNVKDRRFNPSRFKFKYYAVTYEHPTFFVTKTEYIEHIYNIKLEALADYQFMLEAFLANEEKFYYVDETISNFRVGGISAQLSLFTRLKEGFVARKNAGMSYPENIFAYLFRFVVISTYQMLKK